MTCFAIRVANFQGSHMSRLLSLLLGPGSTCCHDIKTRVRVFTEAYIGCAAPINTPLVTVFKNFLRLLEFQALPVQNYIGNYIPFPSLAKETNCKDDSSYLKIWRAAVARWSARARCRSSWGAARA